MKAIVKQDLSILGLDITVFKKGDVVNVRPFFASPTYPASNKYLDTDTGVLVAVDDLKIQPEDNGMCWLCGEPITGDADLFAGQPVHPECVNPPEEE